MNMGAEFYLNFPAVRRWFLQLSSSGSKQSSSSPSTPKMGCSWEEEMRVVFRRFDADSDGKISPSELRAYFASVGERISDDEAQGVIRDLDSDGDGLLGFQDFLSFMASSQDHEDHLEELRKVFEMFEHDKGSGKITPRGLQRMLARLGDSKSYHQCAAMIHMYDVDGNGQLDFQEFYRMMMHTS